MLQKAYQTPDQLLGRELSKRPKATECALVLDPDTLIAWDRPMYEDDADRQWHRLLYAGDDIAFRFGLRRAIDQGGRRLIVVTRGEDQQGDKINLTHLADVLSQVEADPIDLSLVAYFKRLFPKVSPPIDELRQHKSAFVASVPGLVGSYTQFKLRWGEPASWNRGQLLAILLMAKYPTLRLEELWCDETDPDGFLCHAVRLLLRPDIQPEDVAMLRRVIGESSRISDLTFAEPWLGMEARELAAFLVLRHFLGTHDVQHPSTLLAGKLAFSVDPNRLEPQVGTILESIVHDGEAWARINRLAESELTDRKVSQVLLLVGATANELLGVLSNPSTSPILLRETVGNVLRSVFAGASLGESSWMASLQGHPAIKKSAEASVSGQAACLSECLLNVVEVQQAIQRPIVTATHADELLDWYVDGGLHLLELRLAQAFSRLESVGDPDLIAAGERFLLDGSGALKRRLRDYLDQIDEHLAGFITPDAVSFMQGPRSATRVLRDIVYKQRHQFARIWILLFDGMRLDTWDLVVWPILSEFFERAAGDCRPRFAVLPSKTDIARRALFAGGLAHVWKNYDNKWTKDERILAARALGVLAVRLTTTCGSSPKPRP